VHLDFAAADGGFTLYDSSTDPDGTIAARIWRLDGDIVDQSAAWFLAADGEVHKVTLEVVDNRGATANATVLVGGPLEPPLDEPLVPVPTLDGGTPEDPPAASEVLDGDSADAPPTSVAAETPAARWWPWPVGTALATLLGGIVALRRVAGGWHEATALLRRVAVWRQRG
jgi:hypothetical protein